MRTFLQINCTKQCPDVEIGKALKDDLSQVPSMASYCWDTQLPCVPCAHNSQQPKAKFILTPTDKTKSTPFYFIPQLYLDQRVNPSYI
jgi:hypothetical protein